MRRRWIPPGFGIGLIAAAAYAIIRLISIIITPGGDYTLSVTSTETAAVLHPGVVNHFTLTENANANQHKIVGEIPGVNSGDGLMYGQSAGGDFSGTYPSLTLSSTPTITASGQILGLLTPGDCVDTPFSVPGANSGMVATVSLPGTPDGLIGSAWVDTTNSVTVRVCSPGTLITLVGQALIAVVR